MCKRTVVYLLGRKVRFDIIQVSTTVDTPCWIVTSHKSNCKGYPTIRIWNDKLGKWGVTGMNRVIYSQVYDIQLKDLDCVCHHCDIPPCINPEHLFEGTQADNTKDMAIKERSGMLILTGKQVQEIRKLKGIFTQKELAEKFHVTRVYIDKIQNNKRRIFV